MENFVLTHSYHLLLRGNVYDVCAFSFLLIGRHRFASIGDEHLDAFYLSRMRRSLDGMHFDDQRNLRTA